MELRLRPCVTVAIALAFLLTVGEAVAAQVAIEPDTVVSQIVERFAKYHFAGEMLEAAKKLFWGLATISLVWTMAVHLVRQDIGDMMMELVRFMVVTGFFYWMLVNVTEWNEGHGFVQLIIDSFVEMPQGTPNDSVNAIKANALMSRGLTVFFTTVRDVSGGNIPDQLVGMSLATIILLLLAGLAAQFLLLMVMAWVLAYAGVFLLGFGGSRWTSQVAVSYYKHVLAVGAALVSLTAIGTIGDSVLGDLALGIGGARTRSVGQYDYLGMMLGVSVLMLVLGIRVPQLVYALVTQSSVGLFAGTAAAAGSAIASGGNAIASSLHRPPQGGGSGGAADAVMAAVSRGAPGGDAFHVGTGTDPFGVPRRADPLRHGTAFGRATTTATPVGADDGERMAERRDTLHRAASGSAWGGDTSPPNYSAELDQAAAARKAGVESTTSASPPPARNGVDTPETTRRETVVASVADHGFTTDLHHVSDEAHASAPGAAGGVPRVVPGDSTSSVPIDDAVKDEAIKVSAASAPAPASMPTVDATAAADTQHAAAQAHLLTDHVTVDQVTTDHVAGTSAQHVGSSASRMASASTSTSLANNGGMDAAADIGHAVLDTGTNAGEGTPLAHGHGPIANTSMSTGATQPANAAAPMEQVESSAALHASQTMPGDVTASHEVRGVSAPGVSTPGATTPGVSASHSSASAPTVMSEDMRRVDTTTGAHTGATSIAAHAGTTQATDVAPMRGDTTTVAAGAAPANVAHGSSNAAGTQGTPAGATQTAAHGQVPADTGLQVGDAAGVTAGVAGTAAATVAASATPMHDTARTDAKATQSKNGLATDMTEPVLGTAPTHEPIDAEAPEETATNDTEPNDEQHAAKPGKKRRRHTNATSNAVSDAASATSDAMAPDTTAIHPAEVDAVPEVDTPPEPTDPT